MRDSIEEWCQATQSLIPSFYVKKEDMNSELIQDIAVELLENFKNPTHAILSYDLYKILEEEFSGKVLGPTSTGPINIKQFITTAGPLTIIVVPRYRNLLFIGSVEEFAVIEKHNQIPFFMYADEERLKMEKEAEDILLG